MINQFEFTRTGYVKLVGQLSLDQSRLFVIVEDTGVGISEAQQVKLFTPFTKIQSNRQMNRDGVGLGLTVSKNIANALGGDIEVSSIEGQGSKFTFSHPIVREQFNKIELTSICEANFSGRSEREGPINPQFLEKNLKIRNDREQFLSLCIPKNYPVQTLPDLPRGATYQPFISHQQHLYTSCKYELHLSTLNLNGESLDQQVEFLIEESVSLNDIRPSRCSCPQILLVDDEPFNLIALEGLFNMNGITSIQKANNGQEAFDFVKQSIAKQCEGEHSQYRLVMLDNRMPIMSGVQAATLIRALPGVSQTMSLVLITGDVQSDSVNRIFNRVMLKPVTMQDFNALLSDLSLV